MTCIGDILTPRPSPSGVSHSQKTRQLRGGSSMVRRGGVFVLLALLLLPLRSEAQTVAVAQLSGTVLDESGGALPGAEVTVTHTDTAMTRFALTNARGGHG